MNWFVELNWFQKRRLKELNRRTYVEIGNMQHNEAFTTQCHNISNNESPIP